VLDEDGAPVRELPPPVGPLSTGLNTNAQQTAHDDEARKPSSLDATCRFVHNVLMKTLDALGVEDISIRKVKYQSARHCVPCECDRLSIMPCTSENSWQRHSTKAANCAHSTLPSSMSYFTSCSKVTKLCCGMAAFIDCNACFAEPRFPPKPSWHDSSKYSIQDF